MVKKWRIGARMQLGLLSLAVFCCVLLPSRAEMSQKLGVCYGELGNNLPPPCRSVQLIKDQIKANRVKIYGANAEILKSLKNTGLQVSIMVPDDLIANISRNQTLADQWVLRSVVPFYPETMIRYLLVGNEILSLPDNGTWYNLVEAMRRVKCSLKRYGIRKVKVGTPMAMDVLATSFPPSNASFRLDIAETVMKPLLRFLNVTKSFFFIDVYPYFPWASDPKNINLDYALFEAENLTYTDPGSGLTYINLFDQMLDSVIFAMERLGYPDIRLFIAETGWPNNGDIDQIGCNVHNAAIYNRNVVLKLTRKPPLGTPARPGTVLPAFIFALFNENQKPGLGTERNFGLLYPNGSSVYEIDLTGETPEQEYKPLPKAENNEPYQGPIWCVVAKDAKSKTTELAAALSYACSQGNETCAAIQPGEACYKAKSLVRRASYAFSSYWAQFRNIGGTCYFNGLAVQTTKDPGSGLCKFPSVTLL